MLDFVTPIHYIDCMTYYHHTPLYYKIRTVVRTVFWTAVALGAFVALNAFLNGVQDKNSKPVCDVTLERDFTWSWNGTAIHLTTCDSPEDVVLNVDGTWRWFDPIIDA